MAHTAFPNFFARCYDKLIFVASAVFLVSALVAFSSGHAHNAAPTGPSIATIPVRNPELKTQSTVHYTNSIRKLVHPFAIAKVPEEKSAFFLPEERIWCANPDCRQPITAGDEKCALCGIEQPRELADSPDYDSDGDGIPDAWEKKYGLNPHDPADAALDSDNDGFTNLDEYKAGTNPIDPKSHIDLVTLLRVERIDATALPIMFTAKMTGSGGKARCTFNCPDAKGKLETVFVYEGEEIGVTGFKLVKYFSHKGMRQLPGYPAPKEVDIDAVTIEKAGKQFNLDANERVAESDYKITIIQTHDGMRFELAGDSIFNLGSQKFRVSAIDRKGVSITIENAATKKLIIIPSLQ